MAECLILHTGMANVDKMKIHIGEYYLGEESGSIFPAYHCIPGYCDGGDAAHYYWALGSLPITAYQKQILYSTETISGPNGSQIRRITTQYSLRVLSWNWALSLLRFKPIPMSSALSEEPDTPNLTTSLYVPRVEKILDALDAGNGNLVWQILRQSAIEIQGVDINRTYTIPCLASLRFDVPTGESFPAFTGAGAAAVTFLGSTLEMTQDNVVFDGTFSTVDETVIESGSGSGWEEW